jgi:hypothetical protein
MSSCGSRSRATAAFPAVLERRRRIDRALFAVVIEAYVHGVSTRKVDDLVAALGLESGISKSEASRICSELDDTLEAFRTRPTRHGVTGKPGTKRISRVRVRPENGAYVWRKPHDSEGARASEASGER